MNTRTYTTIEAFVDLLWPLSEPMQLCYLARREGQVVPQEVLYVEAVNRLFFLCQALEVSQFMGGGCSEQEASEMSALLHLLQVPSVSVRDLETIDPDIGKKGTRSGPYATR